MSEKNDRLIVVKIKHHYDHRLTPSPNLWQKAWRRLRQDRTSMIAIGVIVVISIIALLAPFVSESFFQVDPVTLNLRDKYLPPFSEGHLLGTDELGRDNMSRLLYGAQISLAIAIASAVLSVGIGIVIGVSAGFYGGVVDDINHWLINTLNAILGLYLLIIITSVLSPSPLTLVLIFALLSWTGTTRLVRAETYSIKEREYIVVARAMGASNPRIMFIHIVPNMLSLLIFTLTQAMGGLILAESALSFLGFGVHAPTPTWGNMLNNALEYARQAPHLIVLPGLLITITVFCPYLIGDGLRDAFDPKTTD